MSNWSNTRVLGRPTFFYYFGTSGRFDSCLQLISYSRLISQNFKLKRTKQPQVDVHNILVDELTVVQYLLPDVQSLLIVENLILYL